MNNAGPIETLMNEHRNIERVLGALRRWAKTVTERSGDQRSELTRFVSFIRSYADALHHGKEEDLLFVAMIEHGFSREAGPIAVMLEEHEEARALTKRMGELAEQAQPWTDDDRRAIARAAMSYAALLSDHIEKEDQVLYPMAESELPPENMDKLARAFEIFDTNAENSKVREQMLAFVSELD